MRITVHDSEGKQAAIEFECKNEALDVPSRKAVEEYAKAPTIFFTQCDDVEAEHRLIVAIFKDRDNYSNREYIKVDARVNNTVYLYNSTLTEIAFHASVQHQAEYLLESPRLDKGVFQIKTFAMVDLKKRLVYGLRFDLKTSTSSTTDYFKIPVLEG